MVFSSHELSFYKASASLSQATYLLHRNRASLGSFQHRKCLRKWIYGEIFQGYWVLPAIWNIPQIFWISASIALSHLLAIAEMVYHQLLGFSLASTWSYPSCVWRIQKRNLIQKRSCSTQANQWFAGKGKRNSKRVGNGFVKNFQNWYRVYIVLYICM